MSVSKDKKTGHWSYNFMFNGVRYHRNFKEASYDDVVGYEAIARAELRKSGYDITDNKVASLSEIVSDFKLYAENNYSRPKEAILVVDNFYKLIGNKPAEQVSNIDFENYISLRKSQKKINNKNKYISNSAINREMDNIRRMFSLAKSNKKIRFNPCDNLKKLKIENPAKRFLQKDEEPKLLKASSFILQAAIILALHGGMRSSEITNLKWPDVFLRENYLIALNTKNGRPRKIVLTPKMKYYLKRLPKLSDYVFTNPITKQPYKSFKSSFKRAVTRAGIPYMTFHELRHSTASRLNELGVDLITIQEILDHADARTTLGYIHKPKRNITDAIKRLSEY